MLVPLDLISTLSVPKLDAAETSPDPLAVEARVNSGRPDVEVDGVTVMLLPAISPKPPIFALLLPAPTPAVWNIRVAPVTFEFDEVVGSLLSVI